MQKLLSGVYVPLKQELDEWVNASYTNNPKEPQKLIHKTIPGILVRSKSEALIINASVSYTHLDVYKRQVCTI